MKTRERILGLGGSIRANPRFSKTLLDVVNRATDLDNYTRQIKELISEGTSPSICLSNAEICVGASLLAAKLEGAEIDFFSLAGLFRRKEAPILNREISKVGLHEDLPFYDFLDVDQKYKDQLIEKIQSAQGLILASPVYFGDRSSVSNKAMQILRGEKLLQNKLVASVSTGAKRNGGQETTNIFHLGEALSMGAYIVGNGPSSAQYGGTVIAGDIGTAVDDAKGLLTCFGTGKRIAQTARLFSLEPDKPVVRTKKVAVLVTMDTPEGQLAGMISELTHELASEYPDFRIDIVQLLDGEISRCIACSICPIPEMLENGSYACIIENSTDMMKSVREVLLEADGLIIAGLNLRDMSNVLYRYQAFTERTRFLRRNDFELTNLPIAAFVLEEVAAAENPLFALKVMTSYLRHNTIVSAPIRHIIHEGKVLHSSLAEMREFLDRVEFITDRREISEGISVSYKAAGIGGYRDGRLDSTEAIRR